MNVLFYTDKLRDELEDAKGYIEDAINCKSSKPEHASMLSRMSEDELSHAKYLIKMFEDDFKAEATEDSLWDDLHNSILNMYTEYSAKVKMMHQTFSEK